VTAHKNPTGRMVVDIGTVKHAIRLLKWWADDESDDPGVREVIMQSVEVARAFTRDLRHPKRFRFAKSPRRKDR
jgi:hypothetical protein